MVKNKFSFVMPMVINHRTTEDNDLERLVKIQLPTFRKFLKLEDLHKFYIVSRESDLPIIESELKKEYDDFPFEYIDERELLPQLKTFPLHQRTVHPGWIIQQLAKFELAKVMETEYYMTFETDLFLTKPFSYENLFNDDGKLICSHYTEFPGTPTKDMWHIFSTALVFNGEIETFNLDKDNKNEIVGDELKINKVMGVSPQFLITEEVKNLINHLENTHKMSYIDLLLNSTTGHPNTWTEYTLYWMWLYKSEKIEELYSFNEPYVCYNELCTFNYRQGYDKKYFGEFDSHIMENPQHYFNLVQSNLTHLKLDFIVDKIKKHLE
jgi:hypothetical protein